MQIIKILCNISIQDEVRHLLEGQHSFDTTAATISFTKIRIPV
jgi:hypothetical protein